MRRPEIRVTRLVAIDDLLAFGLIDSAVRRPATRPMYQARVLFRQEPLVDPPRLSLGQVQPLRRPNQRDLPSLHPTKNLQPQPLVAAHAQCFHPSRLQPNRARRLNPACTRPSKAAVSLTLSRPGNEDVSAAWRIGLRRSATRAPVGCHTAMDRADLLRPIPPHPTCRRHQSAKLRGLGQSPKKRFSLLPYLFHPRDKASNRQNSASTANRETGHFYCG